MMMKRVKAHIMGFPDQSKAETAVALGISESSVARARKELIEEGKLQPSRKAPPREQTAPTVETPAESAEPAPPAKVKKKDAGTMLDHAAMMTLADMADVETDKIDDDEIQKRLLKQAARFAFDPRLHPDTRMSASQMWSKLRDQAKAKNLGPGAPKTFADGVRRLADLHVACGVDMVMAAIQLAFNVKEAPDEGKLPAVASEAVPSPAGANPAS
jgi:transposase-like protein